MYPESPVEHTTGKINPAKTCQPIGAMYAALGIHGCLPHSHGSQGCCAYHRMHLTRHFRDPVLASSSSFTEGASVFGGAANLKTSIKNVFAIYNPEIMAVHTTCLSETIGDDIPNIIKQAEIPEGKTVIHVNTPSYQGSHVTGFSGMCKAMVSYLAESDGFQKDQVNILPGFVNPGDMREIRRIVTELGVKMIMFPDTSGVLDTPLTNRYQMYPEGGATVAEIRDAGNSELTLALGAFASNDAANLLQEKCGVTGIPLKLPIGLKATDDFIMAMKDWFGVEIPASLDIERGQVVDTLIDTHFHYQGKTVAIFGDPDHVIALTEFLLTMGMVPEYVLTGTPGKTFETEIRTDARRGRDHGQQGKSGRRPLRTPAVDQGREGRSPDRHFVWQVHRPGRGYPARPVRVPDPGPGRPPAHAGRRLPGMPAPDRADQQRAPRPPGPRLPG